jgi:hypothetical protein
LSAKAVLVSSFGRLRSWWKERASGRESRKNHRLRKRKKKDSLKAETIEEKKGKQIMVSRKRKASRNEQAGK